MSQMVLCGVAPDGSLLPVAVDADGKVILAAASVGGDATEAKQDVGNTSLAAINGKLPSALGRAAAASSLTVVLSTEDAAKMPALGQALAAGSVPVVLPAAQASGALALDATLQSLLTALAPVSSGGNYTATASNVAAALANHAAVRGVLVLADSSNTATVYVGFSGVTSSTGFDLAAGESKFFPVNNSNLIYIIAPSGSPVVRYEVT